MFEAPVSNRIDQVINKEICTLRASLEIKKRRYIMRAVIKTGGKQYLVSEGSVIFVEKLAGKEGDKVVFDEVLMLDSKVGNPYVSKASVEGVILKQGKSKKIRVFKYSQKDRSNRRTLGHRQPYTKIEIKKING